MNGGNPRALIDLVADLARATSARSDRAQRIAEVVRGWAGYRWVGVYTVGDTTVSVEAWSGPSAPTYPTFARDRGLTGAAIAAADVVVSNDVASDPRYLTNLVTTGSELIAPVLVGHRVVGTVDIESNRPGAFTAADVDLARQIANAAKPLWGPPAAAPASAGGDTS